jgi:peptidyl-prolyl cis-trans isomerase C
MSRTISAFILVAITVSAFAQEAAKPGDKVVATINGEVLTRSKLDALYANLGAAMRAQYDNAGGKMAFLDNYIAKKLMVQEALQSDFDKRPEIKLALESARESALFDRYVRDVISAGLITDGEMRKLYDDTRADFMIPASAHVFHIIVTPNGKTKEQALATIQSVQTELFPLRPPGIGATDEERSKFLARFGELARQYSEDASKESGGDLGWLSKGTLDPKFEEVAFNIRPGVLSSAIETQFGYHLIYVAERRLESTQPYEEVRGDIREFLLSKKSAEIMEAVKRISTELRQSSKVVINRENVD